jgi:hypothetical protein
MDNIRKLGTVGWDNRKSILFKKSLCRDATEKDLKVKI